MSSPQPATNTAPEVSSITFTLNYQPLSPDNVQTEQVADLMRAFTGHRITLRADANPTVQDVLKTIVEEVQNFYGITGEYCCIEQFAQWIKKEDGTHELVRPAVEPWPFVTFDENENGESVMNVGSKKGPPPVYVLSGWIEGSQYASESAKSWAQVNLDFLTLWGHEASTRKHPRESTTELQPQEEQENGTAEAPRPQNGNNNNNKSETGSQSFDSKGPAPQVGHRAAIARDEVTALTSLWTESPVGTTAEPGTVEIVKDQSSTPEKAIASIPSSRKRKMSHMVDGSTAQSGGSRYNLRRYRAGAPVSAADDSARTGKKAESTAGNVISSNVVELAPAAVDSNKTSKQVHDELHGKAAQDLTLPMSSEQQGPTSDEIPPTDNTETAEPRRRRGRPRKIHWTVSTKPKKESAQEIESEQVNMEAKSITRLPDSLAHEDDPGSPLSELSKSPTPPFGFPDYHPPMEENSLDTKTQSKRETMKGDGLIIKKAPGASTPTEEHDTKGAAPKPNNLSPSWSAAGKFFRNAGMARMQLARSERFQLKGDKRR